MYGNIRQALYFHTIVYEMVFIFYLLKCYESIKTTKFVKQKLCVVVLFL
jgi:hypothetical protein